MMSLENEDSLNTKIIPYVRTYGKISPLAAWISTRLSRKTVLEFVFDCNGKPKKS